jgi:hypothetical protein
LVTAYPWADAFDPAVEVLVGCSWVLPFHLLGRRRQLVDPESIEVQQQLDEAFDIVVLDGLSDDDWPPGESDITWREFAVSAPSDR